MLPMMRNQTMKSRRSAERRRLGSMVLASATAAFIWLVLRPAPAAAACLTAVAWLIASLHASLIMMLRFGATRRKMETVRRSASGDAGPGATFQFTRPLHREDST
jgi:hypothetical protein